MKTCKECKRELEENMFNTAKGKHGEIYLRGSCRDCENSKRRKRTTIKQGMSIENKAIERMANMVKVDFTDKEILEVVLNKNNRIHTVFNLDKDVRENIKKMADDKKLNMSDVANLIFKNFFKN